MATSRNGRWVRRYRGGNILKWLTLSGFLDVPRKELVLPSGKLQARALVGATHTISLQSLSAQGVVLLGRFRGVENGSLVFGDELDDHMRFADEVSANAKRLVDEYIERAGLDAPLAEDDPAETIEPRLPDPPIRSLDWTASGIRSVIWCTGFTGHFMGSASRRARCSRPARPRGWRRRCSRSLFRRPRFRIDAEVGHHTGHSRGGGRRRGATCPSGSRLATERRLNEPSNAGS
ncbi:hypothetical protein [Mesorhizobium sp. M0159]|uniref:hypothetical protein n=1 Tax=unclassified Mesorhizobium TaxID=325217 RepID=UPI00333D7D3F